MEEVGDVARGGYTFEREERLLNKGEQFRAG
jgi:hypothetical protein